jgi:1,3-beta-glucanosyltransferase GAS3
MQRLGINAIRVYNLDPEVNHDMCASIFNAVGIYMLLDVNSPLPNESLDRGAPWNSYNVAYLNRTFAVVEAFKNYPNTLLFFAGNEVIIDLPSSGVTPPYVRVSRRMALGIFSSNLSPSAP